MHRFRHLRLDGQLTTLFKGFGWPQRRLLTFGVVLAITLGAILAVPLSRTSLIERGQPSPATVEAPTSLNFTSDVQTRQAQAAAEQAVAPVYRVTPGVFGQQRAALEEALDRVEQIRDDPSLDAAEQQSMLTALPSPPISPTLALALIELSDNEWEHVAGETLRVYDQVLHERNDELTEEDVIEVRERVLPFLPELASLTPQQRAIILHFVGSVLKANKLVDLEATERLRAEAREAVTPIEVRVIRGENIVRSGDIVTDAEYEKLSKLGLVRGVGGLTTTLQMLLLGALIAWLFSTYIGYCQTDIACNDRSLVVIGVLLGIALLAGRLLIPNWDPAPYAFPFATMAILLTVLFNGELALVAALAMAPLLGLQHEERVGLTLSLAIGAAAGVFTARWARRHGQFAIVGFAVTVFTALAAFVFWLGPASDANSVLRLMLFSLVNGTLSAVLAVGSYHYLGRLAGVVTPLELMELSHPNQPLLRRLMREAPGTYHHSMVVSNLAEVAAENIGADPLLMRVGAYYHDVGKLLRPYFFTDNQHDRSNVHDVLDARTSASVIIDHVREGAKLARENGLPQRVVDFIPQHHGTNLVSFFYQRALQEDQEVDIDEFRYPGPKPQTREAAILMLADGVEAAVRAKAQAGKLRPARPEANGSSGGQSIAEIVDQIVNERIAAGQLDEAPITLRDVSIIKESFVQTLQGIYHPRVDYVAQRARFDEDAVPK